MSVLEPQTAVRAQAKWVRMSPRKARLVAEHIRGRSVPEARTILAFTDRRAARVVEKVLSSAVANAEANHGLIGDELIVEAAYVDEGPVIKRWRARARGRVARIRKPTCHITLRLVPAPEPLEAAEKPRRGRRTPAKVAEAEPQAAGEAKEKASRRRRAKVEEAQAGEVSPAEEAEGAASEEKPAAERPVRDSGPAEGARGNREAPPGETTSGRTLARRRRKKKEEE
jgi:large subunit ribosomal protein L22